jgi:hypothetical protein
VEGGGTQSIGTNKNNVRNHQQRLVAPPLLSHLRLGQLPEIEDRRHATTRSGDGVSILREGNGRDVAGT